MTDMEKRHAQFLAQHGNKKVSWQPLLAVMESALAAAAKRIIALEEQVAELRSASLTDEAEIEMAALLKQNLELPRWN